jgi:hypothetical protein
MSSVKEIESAVARLSREDLAQFRTWFADFDAEAWDRQFEADAAAGHLDVLGNEAPRFGRGALSRFVNHRANPTFWHYYQQLSPGIQRLADENFAPRKQNPQHASLHFKKTRGMPRYHGPLPL